MQSAIEQSDRQRAVRQRPCPDLAACVGPDARGGVAERILIDGNHFVVAEQRERERIELG
jgi:hypothetical protein